MYTYTYTYTQIVWKNHKTWIETLSAAFITTLLGDQKLSIKMKFRSLWYRLYFSEIILCTYSNQQMQVFASTGLEIFTQDFKMFCVIQFQMR